MRYYQCAPHLLRRSDNRIMQSSGTASPGRGETGGEDIIGEKTFIAPSRPPPGEAVFIGYYPEQKPLLAGLYFGSPEHFGEVYRSNLERWKKVFLAIFAASRQGLPLFVTNGNKKQALLSGDFWPTTTPLAIKSHQCKENRL